MKTVVIRDFRFDCSRIFLDRRLALQRQLRDLQPRFSRALVFERMVLVSRFISCSRKSSFLPTSPPPSSSAASCAEWIFKRANSSLISLRSARIAASCARRCGSICAPLSRSPAGVPAAASETRPSRPRESAPSVPRQLRLRSLLRAHLRRDLRAFARPERVQLVERLGQAHQAARFPLRRWFAFARLAEHSRQPEGRVQIGLGLDRMRRCRFAKRLHVFFEQRRDSRPSSPLAPLVGNDSAPPRVRAITRLFTIARMALQTNPPRPAHEPARPGRDDSGS